jgi:hypothetical protein
MVLDPTFSPPMITDFVDSKLLIRLSVYRPFRIARVNWNSGNYVVAIR